MGRFDWGQIAAPAVYILLIGIALVFVHSGLQGEYGLAALRDARTQKAALEAERDALAKRRARMENQVARLGEDYLDLDLLDQRARAVLGYVRPDELVIR